jgi:hypothetical protein
MRGAEFKTEKDCVSHGGKWQEATNRCEMGR